MCAVNVSQAVTRGDRGPKRPENALKLVRSDLRGEQVQAVGVRVPTVSAVCDFKRTNLTERPSILHDFFVPTVRLERTKRLEKPLEHRFNSLPGVVGKRQGEESCRTVKALNRRDSPLDLKNTPRGNLDRADWTDPVTSADNEATVKSTAVFTGLKHLNRATFDPWSSQTFAESGVFGKQFTCRGLEHIAEDAPR